MIRRTTDEVVENIFFAKNHNQGPLSFVFIFRETEEGPTFKAEQEDEKTGGAVLWNEKVTEGT